MIGPPDRTRLQEAQAALREALFTASDTLNSREYLVLLSFAAGLVARECGRCADWYSDEPGDEAA